MDGKMSQWMGEYKNGWKDELMNGRADLQTDR